MPGNSQRRGAVRRTGSKKGPQVGSGGQRRRGLEGKGPTPRADERPNHKAYNSKSGDKRGTSRPTGGRKKSASTEMVAGRNSVLEALRTQVPVTTMFIANRIDSDDRVREALTIAAEGGIPIMETPRAELDRLTDGAVHQGLAVQVPPYQYAHPKDLANSQIPGVPLIVALDSITDPRNLGAIVRSVAAFGGHGVVVPQRRSAGMTASAWKTSAGAAARIPVAQAANLGLWVARDADRRHEREAWLLGVVTPEWIADLLPETRDLDVEVFALPHLGAVNVVIHGLLGAGVAASTRFDPQAKGLGEWARSRWIDLPEELA